MFTEQFPFAKHVQQLHKQFTLLKKLTIPTALTWKIDWKVTLMDDASHVKTALFKKHPFFSEIVEKNSQPAVYTFSIQPKVQRSIFENYVALKKVSADIRKKNGVQHPEFFNICHVPRRLAESSFLYVGSVKKDVLSRIHQHLGIANSGRTGALYLRKLVPLLPKPPVIEISIYFFDRQYKHLTEQMEYVFQRKFNPMLGKKSIADLTPPADI